MSFSTLVTEFDRGFVLAGRADKSGRPIEIRSPFSGTVIGRTYEADAANLEHATQAAQRVFSQTRVLTSYERKRILQAVSAGIQQRRGEFARTMALEAGKPIKTALAEVDRAVFTFQIAAEEATRISGEYLPLDLLSSTAGRWGLLRRFAIGPVFAITPFNFPLNLVAHKIAPAIAAGCSILLKPAPQTPFCALALAELVLEAGWPPEALSVMPMSNDVAARAVADDRFKLLTFTGSSAIGWQLRQRSGKKKVVLELGGNAGVIIHSDADIDFAVERCLVGGFSYAGQSCISVQRIFVHSSVQERFLEKLLNGVTQLKVGDPLEESTDVGPMIRESDAQRAEDWIRQAVQAGATLHCGGVRAKSVLAPAVLTGTRPEMLVNCREIFAPAVTVEGYDDFDQALAAVNRSDFGLQAGLFTNDARLIFRAYEELEVGGVVVGDVPSFRVDHMPYGGVKDSGIGREGLRYSIEEMTEQKLLVMNLR